MRQNLTRVVEVVWVHTLAGVECLVLVNIGKEYIVLMHLSKLKVRKIIISY